MLPQAASCGIAQALIALAKAYGGERFHPIFPDGIPSDLVTIDQSMAGLMWKGAADLGSVEALFRLAEALNSGEQQFYRCALHVLCFSSQTL